MTKKPINVLSLGAGVQSTAVLLMANEGELPGLDCAVFADTDWEPAAVYRHLDWLESVSEIPIHRVNNGSLSAHTVKTLREGVNNKKRGSLLPWWIGPNGSLLMRQCTADYKIKPVEQFIRRNLLGLKYRQRAKPNSVCQWLGISLDEIQRMAESRNKWATFYYPLIEKRITRAGCLQWMEDHGYPTPPRSSCIVCPFHSDAEWRRLTPEEFEEACEIDEMGRRQKLLRGQAYLHRSLKPLRDVDLRSKDEKSGQLSLWQDECCGVCGV